MKKDLEYLAKTSKKGIYIQWLLGKPFIFVYKPEYLEVNIKNISLYIVDKKYYFLLFSAITKGKSPVSTH